MSLRRPLFALLLVALAGVGVVLAFLRIVVPEPSYWVEPRPLREQALTRHLMLVVVDGLRFDVATDPNRMPRFAQAMRTHASAEVWAGRVSMTTSAVLAFGTGQPGGMDQVVRNIHPRPPAFDSWLHSAHDRGLSLAIAGDPAWKEMYGAFFGRALLDPPGVGIEEDFNPKTFRDTRTLIAEQPSFLVAHFVTPDHQGHAHGIFSKQYRAHILDYDRQLDRLLHELGPDWTVLVTSDHGAVDSGTHGSDTPVQRRTPAFAFGPGIVPNVHLFRPVDQLDLSATLATLLGVAPPVHDRGHVLVEWLKLEPEERTAIACEQARRVMAYAKAEVDAEIPNQPCDSVESARSEVRATDRTISERTGISSPRATLTAIVGFGFLMLIGVVIAARRPWKLLLFAPLLAAVAVALVLYTERAPGGLPNVIRGTLFVLLLAPAILLLLRPGAGAGVLSRAGELGPILVPGALIATYTANTQPLAFVAVAVVFVIVAGVGPLDQDSPVLSRGRLRLSRLRFALVTLSLVLLLRAGIQQDDVFPEWYMRHALLGQLTAIFALFAWFLAEAWRAWGKRLPFVVGLSLAVGSLLLRDHVPALLGRAAIVAFGVTACVLAVRRSSLLAMSFGLASFAWVSRDHEVVAVVLTLIAARGIGDALAPRATDSGRPPSSALVLLLAAAGFGLVFIQRLGIQNQLDFGGLDYRAAAFGDPVVSAWIIGVALGYKYVLAATLVLSALSGPLEAHLRAELIPALAITFVARSGILLLLLFICGSSFWTGLRVLGDIPFAVLGAAATLLLWIGFSAQPSASRSSSS